MSSKAKFKLIEWRACCWEAERSEFVSTGSRLLRDIQTLSHGLHDCTPYREQHAPFPGQPGWAGTRTLKPVWILLEQETVSGSGINWARCKSAPSSRQTTTPAPHHSVFYRPDALPVAQPTLSKHWRQTIHKIKWDIKKPESKPVLYR